MDIRTFLPPPPTFHDVAREHHLKRVPELACAMLEVIRDAGQPLTAPAIKRAMRAAGFSNDALRLVDKALVYGVVSYLHNGWGLLEVSNPQRPHVRYYRVQDPPDDFLTEQVV